MYLFVSSLQWALDWRVVSGEAFRRLSVYYLFYLIAMVMFMVDHGNSNVNSAVKNMLMPPTESMARSAQLESWLGGVVMDVSPTFTFVHLGCCLCQFPKNKQKKNPKP